MRIAQMPELFSYEVCTYKGQKKNNSTIKTANRSLRQEKSQMIMPDLFIYDEKRSVYRAAWNWQDDLKVKIRFEDYHKDIEKMSRKLARKLNFDWQDLAFGEGFFIFENIVEKWNPEKANFKSYFYSVLKNRMLDRLQKKDIRQPGVRRGKGKYFEAPVYLGVQGHELEKNIMACPDFKRVGMEENYES